MELSRYILAAVYVIVFFINTACGSENHNEQVPAHEDRQMVQPERSADFGRMYYPSNDVNVPLMEYIKRGTLFRFGKRQDLADKRSSLFRFGKRGELVQVSRSGLEDLEPRRLIVEGERPAGLLRANAMDAATKNAVRKRVLDSFHWGHESQD